MEIEDHPSALRNRQPILEVLLSLLATDAKVLEIASGHGTHGAYCTAARPDWHWQPSEADPAKLAVLQQRYARQKDGKGIAKPLALDALSFDWSTQQADALLAINLVHISSFEVTKSLMRGASQVLTQSGLLLLYGPYQVDGQHTAASNAEFDTNLRAQDSSWGIRDIQAVELAASDWGFYLHEARDMPANNKFLVFSRNS